MKPHQQRVAEDTLPPAGSAATFDHAEPEPAARAPPPRARPGARRPRCRTASSGRARASACGSPRPACRRGRRRRRGDEVRQAHRGAVGPRREVVAELVGAEDGEQGEGEGHAVEQAQRLQERIEGRRERAADEPAARVDSTVSDEQQQVDAAAATARCTSTNGTARTQAMPALPRRGTACSRRA